MKALDKIQRLISDIFEPMARPKRRRGGISARQLSARRPHMEPLEPRQLLAVDVSPAPFVQWFEASYETIIDRAPDLFEAGYGAIWTPPPTRGDTSDFTVGYDVYDRFDLGQWDRPTLYGTREGIQRMAEVLGEAGVSLHVDFIMNHNGYSSLSTPGFVEAGGYPGLTITLPNDIDGDFHGAFWGGPEYERLAGLIDIAQEKNYGFIRNPVDPNDPNNIPAGTTPAFGRIANVPDPSNAQFYPDIGYNTIFVFDPVTGESGIPVHSFNPDNPLAGDPTVENALGYLMRNAQWLVQVIGVDGLRIDAGKHMQGFVFDFLDRAVYRTNPRTLLDGSPQHVFSYTEVFDANPAILLPHVKKTIDPNDPGTIGGNRDTLDFKWYFAVKDNLEHYGQGGAWFNVKDAGLDVAHNGFHDGSAGVKFVQNHDVFKPFKLHNVATTLQLMLPGNAVVYFNGKEFGDNREFPKEGRGDSLSLDSVTSRLVEIRESHGKGNYAERWVDSEGIYIFERVSNAVVGLSNRGDGGFDERTVEVGFAPGTLLVELTGNAADPNVDPFNDIPEVVTVFQGGDGKSYANIRVPRNLSATGFEHQKGFVIYGLGTPQASNHSLELIGVDSVLAGDTNINSDFENGIKRQSDIHVVTADSFQVRLQTNEVRHLGVDDLRDIYADGDSAFLKLDGGEDINGNGFVDFVTPGSDVYGFEGFGDKSSPLIGSGGVSGPRGDGEFLQTIDTTQLEEGIHFLEARAFRHRTDGGPATYSIFKETIYVDRLAPDTGVFEIRAVNSLNSGDHDIVFKSLDSTADSVHAFANLPASVTDVEIIAMATSGEGSASQVDVDHYKTFLGGLGQGNNVWTVVTFESTGTTNVQRITGQSIGDHGQGGGLGDLDRNFIVNVTDIEWFAGLLSSGDTLFNPSADFDGDGLITEVDTQMLGDRLIEVGADQATLNAYQALVNGGPDATDDGYGTDEDIPLFVNAANGVLSNDSSDSMNATVQSGPFNAQSFQLNQDGSFSYTPNTNYNGPDSFTYRVDDGAGGFDTANVSLTISPVNDSPNATGTSASTNQNVAVDIDLRNLVDDVETTDDLLQFSVSDASNGSVELLGDGYTARFTPATDHLGPAGFSYEVTDGGDNGAAAKTVGPVAISVDVSSLTLPTADLSDPANGAALLVSAFDGRPYIEVTFSDEDDGLNPAWIDGDELLLGGSGLGTVILDGAPVAQGNGRYQYPISGDFVPGTVDVTFVAGTFADLAGNTNLAETESFTVLSDAPGAFSGNVSAPAILQWFETSWETMIDRSADLFLAGYGGVWTPPPGRGIYTVEGGGIGYDVYDRFDLGRPGDPTLYGTETGYKTAVAALQRAGALVYADFIINHASSFDPSDVDANGVAFWLDPNNPEGPHGGGNPGFVLSLPGDPDGDFHPNPTTEFQEGDPEWEYQFQLAQLYDIDHRKFDGYQFIRQPVTPGDPSNIPSAGTAVFLLPKFDLDTFTFDASPTPRVANLPDEYNRRFYPDQTAFFVVNDHVPGDPGTPETGVVLYNFTGDEATTGIPVLENANALLMRHARWMVQEIGIDGFRVDAARHVYPFVHDFYDRAVFLADQRPLLDGSQRHVFSFLESFTGDKDFLQTFVQKDINPNDLGTVGGNRDVLDLPLFFGLRDNLTDDGFNNNWHNIVNASQDVRDDGFANNGSQAVAFVGSHDEDGAFLNNVAHAYVLTRPGNAVVYHNAREFNADPTVNERPFPHDGRGDALGGVYGDAVTTLLDIRNTHGQGDYLERWIDPEFSNFYAFEREGSMVVGLNSRNGGSGNWDERTIETSFPEGTLLLELTGNASNPTVDVSQGGSNDIPEVVAVGPGGQVTLRVPQNTNEFGEYHGLGYVIYGLAGPQGALTVSNVDSVISGDTPTAQNNPTNRLTDVHVIRTDEFQVQLDTVAVNLLGDPGLRDHEADGGFAVLKFDTGIDLNGVTGSEGNPINGVDYVTPGSMLYGFEDFTTVNDAGYFANGGTGGAGQFTQSIDATSLAEGQHFVTVRAFRQGGPGQPPIFTDFKQVIYVDRLAPDSGVKELRPVNAVGSGDHDVFIESHDLTADNVHVFLNLPVSVTDQEILDLATAGQGATEKVDINLFKTYFGGMASGNNVITVVTFEPTGTNNVQRFTAQYTDGQGDGLGDANFDGQYTPADISTFEALLNSANTQFNPAADLNGDGVIDSVDLILLGDRLVEVGADQATISAYQQLLNGDIEQLPGLISDLSLTDQGVAGERWYRAQASQTGLFAVLAEFDQSAGNIDVAVYDADHEFVAQSSTAGSFERITFNSTSGDYYDIQLVGDSTSVTLRLQNMLAITNPLTVVGTASANSVMFEAGATSHTLTVDGLPYELDSVVYDEFIFAGNDGADTLNLTSLGGSDSAVFMPETLALTGSTYSFAADDVETIEVSGSGTATFYDGLLDEIFTATITSSEMVATGGQYSNRAYGFADVTAYASDGIDWAYLYDSSEDDRFVGKETISTLRGANFEYSNEVRDFDRVHAYASEGTDWAYLYDSSEDDRFVGQETISSLRGANFEYLNQARDFDRVHAYASEGTDWAYLYDSSEDDRFVGQETISSLRGANFEYFNQARDFDQVHAYASEGTDWAYLYDSSEDDRFVGQETISSLRGANFEYLNQARDFDRVLAYASEGDDRAFLYDSSQDDRFVGMETVSTLRGANFEYLNQARDFPRVYAYASEGYDRAFLYDSSEDDRFVGKETISTLRGSNFEYLNQARDFERVYAYASDGHDRAFLYGSSTYDDRFFGRPTYSLLRGENSEYFNRANAFEEVYAYAMAGDADRARVFDGSGDDLFYGRNSRFEMTALNYYYYGLDFDDVRADGSAGDINTLDIDAIDYAFATTGTWN